MSATLIHEPDTLMTAADFMAAPDDPTGRLWQLVDGVPMAMAPASETHGFIQSQIGFLLTAHLRARRSPCRVGVTPGVRPNVNADTNIRVPDLGVTCDRRPVGSPIMETPILLIEILSPGNAAKTWGNVWSYTTIPSVREILVVESMTMKAHLLRRQGDGAWPANPERSTAPDAEIRLETIDAAFALAAFYETSGIAVEPT